MLGLFKYVVSEARVERLRGKQIDLPSEQLFEVVGEFHKVIKGLSPLLKLHEDVYVALVVRLAASEGAEHAETCDTKAAELLAVLTKEREDLLFRFNRHHSYPGIRQSATSAWYVSGLRSR